MTMNGALMLSLFGIEAKSTNERNELRRQEHTHAHNAARGFSASSVGTVGRCFHIACGIGYCRVL
jgi:hypothetical protein